MEENTRFIAGFALIRAVHFGACLLLLCVCVFHLTTAVAQDEDARRLWRPIARLLFQISAPVALLSGAAWFAMIAIQMSGLPPAEALRGEIVSAVWNQTQFGNLWKIRLVFWVGGTVSMSGFVLAPRTWAIVGFALRRVRTADRFSARSKYLPGSQNSPPWGPYGTHAAELSASGITWLATFAGLIFGILLCGSLAWAGHGQTGRAVGWHLTADVIHLLICAAWPMGLLPFGLLLWKLRRDSGQLLLERSQNIARLTRRFSAISVLSVLLLTATGVVNSWVLVGSFASLFSTLYGKTLLIKLALFAAMVLIGAMNLLWWKPRLRKAAGIPGIAQQSAARRLQFNVTIELILSILVLAVVGILGLLPPAIELMHHHHHPPDQQAARINGD